MEKWTKEEVENAVKESISFSGVCRRLNAGSSGSSKMWVKKRVADLNIDYSHFTGQPEIKDSNHYAKKTPEEILVNNQSTDRRTPRKRLLFAMLSKEIKYICSAEGCPSPLPQWKGKVLPLEIDHIDGDWRNNLISNLRFLCPNCHHQTKTNRRGMAISASSMEELEEAMKILEKDNCSGCGFLKQKSAQLCAKCRYSRYNAEIKRNTICSDCDVKIWNGKRCRQCDAKIRLGKTTISYPPVEELIEMIKDTSYVKVSRKLGVSDNAIRKHLKKRNIDPKTFEKI